MFFANLDTAASVPAALGDLADVKSRVGARSACLLVVLALDVL